MKKRLISGALLGTVITIVCYVAGLSTFESDAIFQPWMVFLVVFIFVFSITEDDKDVLELSESKKKALSHAPSKENLSSIPNGLTFGRYGNKYVRTLFNDSPEHQLIYGAPGDGKSTTIQNAIIYDLNFATPSEKLCSMLVVDVKPELSRRGVFEGRDDIKIINPTKMGSCGFDLFYGLSKDSSDDEVYDRCSMIANIVISDTGTNNVYFPESARNIFTAFLMYGFFKGKTFKECIEDILDSSVEDFVAQILEDDEI